ncbi:NHLP-related RiPP peptide [Lysobacter sp. LF1]|uniref:NHLP-related RiPP peptide n=1 Tax=Lysobacter stagni TaxID=3045172 RepID=A0ABT6XCR1_9GAMM|nr:NHLP-related RiPP peptide [Lysobacter sp. LF1]MDI9237913.1 NHLP-related RiPP peptide [Lysobacter sp. LF1]
MQAISTEQHARPESSGKTRTVPMSRQAALKLVDLLATSDEFRSVFMRDARMALETWQFDQDSIDRFWWDCKMGITQLAPKEVIAAAREEITSMLMAGLNQTTPQLDSGLEGQRRRLA